MGCLLSIFGETPFFELVCVLTATKKLLIHTPAVHETSSHVEVMWKDTIYSRRCKAMLLFHKSHEIIK